MRLNALLALAAVAALAASAPLTAAEAAPKATLPAIIAGEGGEALWIPSGYMGETDAIAIDAESKDQPHTGSTCLKATYSRDAGWGGVVWQHPENDWGEKPGGFDLGGAKRLTFWARGAQGGEVVKFGFGILGADKPYHDSAKGEKQLTLTREWTEYGFDLAGLDLSRIKTGFMWVVGGQGKPVVFYLDDAQFR